MTAPTRTLQPHGTLAAYARHKQRGEDACAACKAARRDYSRASRADGLQRRTGTRRQAGTREAVREAIRRAKPFQIPRCADCLAPLADAKGNPRWGILEDRFVCLGRCAPRRRPANGPLS